MPEVEILPACDYYGIGVAPYSPIARGVLTGKYRGGAAPDGLACRAQGQADAGNRIPRGVDRDRATSSRRTPRRPAARRLQFALAWLWANRIVIVDHRRAAHARAVAATTSAAIGTTWNADDEALVDSLVRPGFSAVPFHTDPQYPVVGRRFD